MRCGPVAVCLLALLACKSKPAPTPAPAKPKGATPAEVLTLAKKGPFDGQPVLVTGSVLTSTSPESGAPTVTFDAGSGRKLEAAMSQYQCMAGTCYRDPPAAGSDATLQCTGVTVSGTPRLWDCRAP